MSLYLSACCGEEPYGESLTVTGPEASGICSHPDCLMGATFVLEREPCLSLSELRPLVQNAHLAGPFRFPKVDPAKFEEQRAEALVKAKRYDEPAHIQQCDEGGIKSYSNTVLTKYPVNGRWFRILATVYPDGRLVYANQRVAE